MSFSSGGSYADGVPVAIAAACERPRAIEVPRGLLERASAAAAVARDASYDFSLETSVLAKMGEWRDARRAADAARARRLAAKDEARRLELERAREDLNLGRLSLERVDYPSELDDILQPQVVAGPPPAPRDLLDDLDPIERYRRSAAAAATRKRFRGDVGRLTVSDFESDTSSPFDAVALGAINDIEQLAEVLNPVASPAYYSTYSTALNFVEPAPAAAAAAVVPRPGDDARSVPDIVRELDDELRRAAAERVKPKPEPIPIPIPIPEADPLDELSPRLRLVCRYINGMGFPIDRVARACQRIGDDDKKIVEYLLSMSQLMDFGFPENSVADALLKHDCNKDKALDDLIS